MSNYCVDCPLKLLKCKHHKIQGIGNLFSQNIIVIPAIDYNAAKSGNLMDDKQVKEILSTLSSTGGVDGLLSDVYIVPLIRCPESNEIPINKAVFEHCILYLYEEYEMSLPINIIFLGKTYKHIRFVDITFGDRNYVKFNAHNVYYTYTYSLLNTTHKNEVKQILLDWYNTRNETKQIVKQFRL